MLRKPARLPALAVDGQGNAGHRLDTEAIQDGPEDVVIVKGGAQIRMQLGLVGRDAVDDALVQICRPLPPVATAELDVVRVMDFREVIKAEGLLREGQSVAAPVVFDLEVAFFDIDVRRTVLSHRAQLHEMGFGALALNAKQEIQGADDVVMLGVDGVGAPLHRVGRRGLLGIVDDCVRLGIPQDTIGEAMIQQVADPKLHVEPGHLLPEPDPTLQGGDREQRLDAFLQLDLSLREVVDDRHIVARLRKMHSGRPTQIAVAS